MMTKNDTIEAITRLNPTASPVFLAGFCNDDLVSYLQRLSSTSKPQNVFSAMAEPPSRIDDDAIDHMFDHTL